MNRRSFIASVPALAVAVTGVSAEALPSGFISPFTTDCDDLLLMHEGHPIASVHTAETKRKWVMVRTNLQTYRLVYVEDLTLARGARRFDWEREQSWRWCVAKEHFYLSTGPHGLNLPCDRHDTGVRVMDNRNAC